MFIPKLTEWLVFFFFLVGGGFANWSEAPMGYKGSSRSTLIVFQLFLLGRSNFLLHCTFYSPIHLPYSIFDLIIYFILLRDGTSRGGGCFGALLKIALNFPLSKGFFESLATPNSAQIHGKIRNHHFLRILFTGWWVGFPSSLNLFPIKKKIIWWKYMDLQLF